MKRVQRIVATGTCLAGLVVLAAAGCARQAPGWDTAAGVLVSPSAAAGVSEAIKAARLTASLWEQYLKTGALCEAQHKAALARDLAHYLEALRTK